LHCPPLPACLRPTLGLLSLGDGMELQRSGDLVGAEAVYEAILAARPDDGIAKTLLGSVWCETGRFAAGIELMREVTEVVDYALPHFSLGQAFFGYERMAEAVPAFRRCIGLQPSILAAHIGLGRALTSLGDHEAAAASFRAALLLDPNDPDPYLYTGVLLHQLGRPQDALAQLYEATRLGPERPDTWSALGNALMALLRYDEAEAAYCNGNRQQRDSAVSHPN
jgi:tetratricopeptide (TPR) repeat protein